jgi:hypothetical protein
MRDEQMSGRPILHMEFFRYYDIIDQIIAFICPILIHARMQISDTKFLFSMMILKDDTIIRYGRTFIAGR